MNLDSKQIDETDGEWTRQSSLRTKIVLWIDDHNPFPYSVRYWFYNKDIFHPTRIYRKITNVLRWTPILWGDVDWDYSSLYIMIHKKLKFMREHHAKHHNHTDWKELVQQMQTAEDAIRRLAEDNYLEKEWEDHYNKFPHGEWLDVPGEPGMKQMPPMSKEKEDEFTKLVDAEEKLKQQDYDTFASLFTKNSRGWWD